MVGTPLAVTVSLRDIPSFRCPAINLWMFLTVYTFFAQPERLGRV